MHLPTATAPVSTVGTGRLGDWFRLGVFDKRRPYRQPPRAPVRWLDGNLRKGPGLVTHSRANHGHRWWEPNGGIGTTPGRKRLGNDQPCRRCQEHLDDVAPERRFFSSKWRRGPGPGPQGSRRLREPRGPEVSESLGRTMAIDWAEGSDKQTHCFPPAAPGA